MHFLSPLSLALCSIFLFTTSTTISASPVAADIITHRSTTPQPIYAIAHMVLRNESVTAELSNGANAVEVDLTAEKGEWWTDHNRTVNSAGDTARNLFEFIAQQRRDGKPITFVWLDIKDPDECKGGPAQACSIEALRDITRETLEPAGVRALYGFFGTADSRGYTVIRDSLNANEAVCLSGEAHTVLEQYDNSSSASSSSLSSSIASKQRIMDYGYTRLNVEFGNCHENSYNTCTELRQASDARDQGKLGKVMGWTSAQGETGSVDSLLGEARVDGIIYGFEKADYEDAVGTRSAWGDIFNFVRSHSETHRMATVHDPPW